MGPGRAFGGGPAPVPLLGRGVRVAGRRATAQRRPAISDQRERVAGARAACPVPTSRRAAAGTHPRLARLGTRTLVDLVGPLTNPVRHGGTPADAFDRVIPS